jgi:hypothetical protein
MNEQKRTYLPKNTDDLRKILGGSISNLSMSLDLLKAHFNSGEITVTEYLRLQIQFEKLKNSDASELSKLLSLEIIAQKMEADGIEMHPYIKLGERKILSEKKFEQLTNGEY